MHQRGNFAEGSKDTCLCSTQICCQLLNESNIQIRLEINGHKTKYMTMSRDQNAGRIHSTKMDNSPIERVEEFKYLGTNLTNQNSIQEEIKSRLKLGNDCYYSVQNLLSSSLLSKTLKIKIYTEWPKKMYTLFTHQYLWSKFK